VNRNLVGICVGALVFSTSTLGSAHSVGQVQTAKRIAQATIIDLDPQGNPVPGGMGTDTTAQVGDILSFVIRFTPVPNGASRGAGGYITEYIPPNTEVVGVRIIDAAGKTIPPQRGPQMDDGWGPRNRANELDALGLLQGSLAQVYADTGMFFSTDIRTTRAPDDVFLSVFNGLELDPRPTGINGLGDLLGVFNDPYFGHNAWDLTQAFAYGVNGGTVIGSGNGNTPFEYGSAVAGPQTHYAFEKVDTPACSDGIDNDNDGPMDYPADPDCVSALDDDETNASDGPVGPWQRIRYAGSEIGVGGDTECESCQGGYVRVGVPTDLGWDLSADNALPPGTNAVRFAVGELIVGKEYFAEVSLRVTGLPLDPNMGADVNCAEVFGGDAAMPQNGQDNTWRYFLPGPSCVQLNLVFELDVDKLIAVSGDTLTYHIHGKNLSTQPQTNVVVTDTWVNGDVSFDQIIAGPVIAPAGNTLTWPTMTLQPGEEYDFIWEMTVTNDKETTLNRAIYTSSEIGSPFDVVALTTIEPLSVLDQIVTVAPTSTAAGSNVTYTAVITNSGTGPTALNGTSFVGFDLPTGFTFCGAPGCNQPTINGNGVADPIVNGNRLSFESGLAVIAPGGGTMTVVFDATVGAGVAPGLYRVDIQTTVDDPGVGRDVEIANFGLAALLVDMLQTAPPTLDEPVLAGAQIVTGVTASLVAGDTVTVFVNGNSAPTVFSVGGGVFSAAVPTLYAGQHLNATAQTPGEVESVLSSPDVVVGGVNAVTQCSDGIDNDADGLIDLLDPGCIDSLDPDETDVTQCADGLDNDNDGSIDFPDDQSCSSFLDDTESGLPACGDNVDNDGDGQTDFPDDPGCDSLTDVSEADLPQCANFIDDDMDGLVDYPNDPGCDDAFDDNELDSGAGGGGGGSNGTLGNGGAPDLGGIPGSSNGSGENGDDSGCGCRVVDGQGGSRSVGAAWLLLGLAALLGRRRKERCRELR